MAGRIGKYKGVMDMAACTWPRSDDRSRSYRGKTPCLRGRVTSLARICIGVVLGLAVIVTGHTAGLEAASSPPKLRGTVVWPPGTRPALPFALHDQNGRLVTLRTLRGHVGVVTFLDAHCTSACPVTGRDLALTQRDLGGSRSPLMSVIIDVDPGKDTPAAERLFARKVGLTDDWHWLSGTRRQLVQVWRVWGEYVKPQRRDIIHTAAVYLVDQRGFVRVADEVPFRPDWLAESVRALLSTPPHEG